MRAARSVASSFLASGSSVHLCAASPLRSQTIRAASTSSHATSSPQNESRRASSSKPSPSATQSIKLHGVTRYGQMISSRAQKGKSKVTGYSTSDDQGSKHIGSSPLSASLKTVEAGLKPRRRSKVPPIDSDKPSKTGSSPVAGEKAADWDALASVQDQLRSYFSRPKPIASVTSTFAELQSDRKADSGPPEDVTVEDNKLASSSQELNQGQNSQVDSQMDSQVDGQVDTHTAPRFSRPTLAQLQNTEMDQFAGLYQSRTAWDPSKDYALMQDGPERQSFLRASLSQGPQPYIVIILDGDNLLFSPRHLNQGFDGGKFVYQELRERIAKKHQLVPQRLDLRIRLFASLKALATILEVKRVVRKTLFFDFMLGLTDSNPLNYIVDVGRGNQAADLRVKAALTDALKDDRCFRAYLGGLDDFGYKEELHAIYDMGLLESRVHLVQVPGYAVESNAYRRYAHRAIDLDYLFKNNQAALMDMDKYNQEAFGAVATVPEPTRSKPCLYHHLTKVGCKYEDCTYSHEPITDAFRERLRSNLKKRKCPTISRGEECQFGDDCLFAH